jgi:hypothetical protein
VIAEDAARAGSAVRAVAGEQSVHLAVVDGADGAEYLRRADGLVVRVGAEKPAADFGVLWRPARTVDEAVELGVEVARDLAPQGVSEIVVEVVEPSDLTEGLARGIFLGGLACGVSVKGSDGVGEVPHSSA